MYVAVKTLAPALRSALAAVGFKRADISVEARETVTLDYPADDGARGFATLVDLETGRHETMIGSWGGANMFSPRNRVDLDRTARPLPPGTVLVKGQNGGRGCFAHLYVHPDLLPKLLPAPVELTQGERDGLYCHISLKSGEYRREELRRRRVTQADLDSLVARGFLKRNAAGSTQVTVEGKNACGNYRGY